MVGLRKPVNLVSWINRRNNVRPRPQARQKFGLLVPPYGLDILESPNYIASYPTTGSSASAAWIFSCG
jgi:hypothetical protein